MHSEWQQQHQIETLEQVQLMHSDVAAGANDEAKGLLATAADDCEAPKTKAALLLDAAVSTRGAAGVNGSDAAGATGGTAGAATPN